eukprot:CAMPEP_0179133850 /NCGR_PEP_ID=MMETSP0796-20121207/63667_1 /TAXON_ID=73915 /ORGANISM="Pyrodinium bahamense, Strain pbaha01" /LENGTH=110 /DNA_ID=CAMNT_0020832823 /DNA_START=58 /DNA_END=387 /DNA_ORIENTATION=-
MASRTVALLALAAFLALSAPAAFSLWAPRAPAIDGRTAALRGTPSQAPAAAAKGEASGPLGGASAFAAAAALGLIVALTGAPALAEEAAAPAKKDNPVVTVLTKEERLKQ